MDNIYRTNTTASLIGGGTSTNKCIVALCSFEVPYDWVKVTCNLRSLIILIAYSYAKPGPSCPQNMKC